MEYLENHPKVFDALEAFCYTWPLWFLLGIVLKRIITSLRIDRADIKKAEEEIARLESFIKSSESKLEEVKKIIK